MKEPNTIQLTARLATLNQLLETTVPAFLSPPPSREALRDWFDEAKIPRFKRNPRAKRGGGIVFYSVPAVEKFFRGRTMQPVREAVQAGRCSLPPGDRD